MSSPRLFVAAAVVALVATLVPSMASARSEAHLLPTAEIDFGDCAELSLGMTVPLAELIERVPESVSPLSLTQQGIVFPGSDDLGIVLTRTLECESITRTRNGDTRIDHDRHIAHVGTPVDSSVLPASPFNNDGGNGADFNNYIFGYYSDSSIYLNAMRHAGITQIQHAEIDIHDEPAGECLIERTASVDPRWSRVNYGFTASGVVPDPACAESDVPFIANWWSVSGEEASVLSNNIPAQTAIFIDPAETVITVVPTAKSQLDEIFGAPTAVADAVGVIGFIPETEGTDMVITTAGSVGGPLGGASFALQNFFASPDADTGAMTLTPFFDPVVATVGPGLEVGGYLYDVDFTATSISMVWNVTPDDELPEGAVPNDIYPPFVGAISGLPQDQAAAIPLADEYWFDFDQDLTGLTFTVDSTQTLVPNVRIEDGDTLVISIPGGTDIGDGFDARILIGAD